MLLRFDDKKKYLTMDFETESLNLRVKNRPWEVGFFLFEGNKCIKKNLLYPYFNDLKVGKGAAAITGFKQWEYEQKSTDKEKAFNQFNDLFLDPDIYIVGHNILGFDLYIYQNWAREMGAQVSWDKFLPRCIDTLALSRAHKLEQRVDKDNFLLWQYKMLSIRKRGIRTSLSAMAKEFDIDFDSQMLHKADYDIKLNYKVFKKLTWALEV